MTKYIEYQGQNYILRLKGWMNMKINLFAKPGNMRSSWTIHEHIDTENEVDKVGLKQQTYYSGPRQILESLKHFKYESYMPKVIIEFVFAGQRCLKQFWQQSMWSDLR